MAGTPSNLELSLIEGTDNLKGDSSLIALAKEAKGEGMNYVLEGAYENATHEETADRLADILNQVYQSPLYGEKETFSGAVVYKKNSKYVFRE